MDVLFVNPGESHVLYQGLANDFAAIEPPTWALLLAEACRSKGFSVNILDANAERLSLEEQYDRVLASNARLIVFVVYGQNVNAGTANMYGAIQLSKLLKKNGFTTPIAYIGSYLQALPKLALQNEDSIDFCFTNEGVYALQEVLGLSTINSHALENVRGVCFRYENGTIRINPSSSVVDNHNMDRDLPGYAWDLLPYKKAPLDLYRSPIWHAEYIEESRSPYAAIQTSLGCNFSCSFCMINILNRNDEAEIGVASTYKGMRFWSTEFILKQFDILNKLGVSTIKITDEMFLLYKRHYLPLCEGLSKRPYANNLKMWSYSRVDTIREPDVLNVVRSAGIRWLALGIESAEKNVRHEVTKGKFEDVDIERVVRLVEQAGINVMANYIVGLPGDDQSSMQKTLDFSKKLNTAGWNMYAAMALPGSELFKVAVEKQLELPTDYSAFSFHSYDTFPLRNENLTASDMLKFRDEAYIEYHSSEAFQGKIRSLFGEEAVALINHNLKVRLKRKIFEVQ